MTRGHEFGLGPLWEHAPKSRGFRISIPDPADLSYWIMRTARSHGDLTQEEITESVDDQFEKVLFGQSELLIPDEREWKISVKDRLISSIRVTLSAKYSEIDGEWGGITFSIEPSGQTLVDGRFWQIAANTPQIVQKLQSQGFNSRSVVDTGGFHGIVTPNKDSSSIVNIHLGYTSEEEVKQDDSEYDPDFVDNLLIYLDEFPISLPDSLKNIQHIQQVASYFIDALYESFEMEPPDLILELSKETELH